MALSWVSVATSKLGPACDGVGFDIIRSKRHKAAQGRIPSNYW